jgi:hypothetical protein
LGDEAYPGLSMHGTVAEGTRQPSQAEGASRLAVEGGLESVGEMLSELVSAVTPAEGTVAPDTTVVVEMDDVRLAQFRLSIERGSKAVG